MVLEAGSTGGFDGPFRRERIAVVSVAGLVFLFSLVWGLSGGMGSGVRNPLRASVDAGVASSGVVYLSVTNRSRQAWEDTRLIADGRYIHRAGTVEPGQSVSASMGQFIDRMSLPRADRVFLWERLERAPAMRPPSSVRPERLRIVTDAAAWETSVNP